MSSIKKHPLTEDGIPSEAFMEVLSKVMVSGMVVWLLYLLVRIPLSWHLNSPEPSQTPVKVPGLAQPKFGQKIFTGNARAFWPHFPGNSAPSTHQMILNGVQTLTEEWQTGAAGAEVIAYYRRQMTARGWQDVTEESYKFQPELRHQEISRNGLQDDQYLQAYATTMNSTLVLRRGNWTVKVVTSKLPVPMAWTQIVIYAAETASINDLVEPAAGALKRNADGSPSEQPVDAVQFNGQQRYHTTISSQREEPERAFAAAMAKLNAKSWHTVTIVPSRTGRRECLAWLTRGEQYAALYVKPGPGGKGSSVAIIDVLPR